MEIITSRQNKLFKHIRDLKEDKKYRKQSGEFWIDGVNFVSQALRNGWKIKTLVYVLDEINSEFKKEIVKSIPEENRVAFSRDLYASLSAKKDIQGVGAIIEEKSLKAELNEGPQIILEHISTPGNVRTIMRTCVAFGVKNIVIVNPAVDPFSFDVVRASMGAIFHLQISIFESTVDLGTQLGDKVSVGTSLQDDSIDILRFDFKAQPDLAIWFGNEAKGLTTEARSYCKTLLYIPMGEQVDSLNISESVGIVLWEMKR